MSAELARLRTEARAVLDEYLRAPGTADANTLSQQASRLAQALALMLGDFGNQDGAATQLAKIRQVLDAFDWEGDSDLQYALEHIDDIVHGRPR